ncbi:ester cyclase [Lutimaribacter sp. EGI FJ00015]|uniref:Ester cyclase n=1 Tax=Lutimaribacter degradans TaxID=2945989 RepID=A0ACC5ZSF7_9RHOB|nr:ester cyclase [Lutimaribacter sp. EGI FJ00013]MCM2561236.1 ester cyclase [Lutimaribacter sp. EGI FJ00013]MCO0611815.1 ester cyclase [Lutimaribacter sp. EGI FJ00015]MCO0635064.1 ester cyclase [Lutimaribacter sp. EGI FJ00014]
MREQHEASMNLLERTESFLRAIWEEGDAGALGRILTEDAKMHGLEEMDLMGPAAFAAFHCMVLRQFEDVKITEVTGISDGPMVAMSFRISAVERRKHRHVSCMAYLMARYRGDKICEGQNFLDFVSLFEQAGRLPARTRDMCLLGSELHLVPQNHRRAH